MSHKIVQDLQYFILFCSIIKIVNLGAKNNKNCKFIYDLAYYFNKMLNNKCKISIIITEAYLKFFQLNIISKKSYSHFYIIICISF